MTGYTASLFGSSDSLNNDHSPLKISAPDLNLSLPDLQVSLPDKESIWPEQSEASEPLDTPAPAITDTSESSESNPADGSLDTNVFAVAVREELVSTTERIRSAVLRYMDGQANKMTVKSRIEKEQVVYLNLLNRVESRLSNHEFANSSEEALIRLLHSDIAASQVDAEWVKESSRTELIQVMNEVIQKENERHQAFLMTLKSSLDASNVPYQEINGQLIF